MSQTSSFELAEPTPIAFGILFLLAVLLPVAVTAVASSADAKLIGGVLAVSFLVFAVLAAAAKRRGFVLSKEGILVRSSFYTLFVERSAIKVEEIRATDYAQEPAYAPAWRTNGLSMPGFRSGWFRTRGSNKAFVVSSGSNCVVIPTTKGFLLVLGSTDAQAAAQWLKASLR